VTEHLSHSEADTTAVGRGVGQQLRSGDVLLLSGPLGAGKTAFVRGLAEGLGCSGDDVSSPTFAIVQEYHGRFTLQHVDLYRLNSTEVDDLSLIELAEDAAMAVEWPERWRSAPADAWRVTFEIVDETTRRIEIYSTR